MCVCVCLFLLIQVHVYITDMVLMNMHRVDCFVHRMFTSSSAHYKYEYEYALVYSLHVGVSISDSKVGKFMWIHQISKHLCMQRAPKYSINSIWSMNRQNFRNGKIKFVRKDFKSFILYSYKRTNCPSLKLGNWLSTQQRFLNYEPFLWSNRLSFKS